jgi:hypothetical protein
MAWLDRWCSGGYLSKGGYGDGEEEGVDAVAALVKDPLNSFYGPNGCNVVVIMIMF